MKVFLKESYKNQISNQKLEAGKGTVGLLVYGVRLLKKFYFTAKRVNCPNLFRTKCTYIEKTGSSNPW